MNRERKKTEDMYFKHTIIFFSKKKSVEFSIELVKSEKSEMEWNRRERK